MATPAHAGARTSTRIAPHAATPPDESTTGKHLPALDGVRGIAIGLVLLMHLYTRHHTPAGPAVEFIYDCINTSWIGVDLFFVLSGFLITGILYDPLPDPHFFRNFFARRALRILPLYYLNIALTIGIGLLVGVHWFWRPVLVLLAHLSTLVHVGDPSDSFPANLGLSLLWSLNVEEQFYLLWPVAVFLLRTRRRIALGALVGVAGSLTLRLWWHASGHSLGELYTWTPARLDGLLLGGALAMLVRSDRARLVLRWSPAVLATGLCALAAGIAYRHGISSQTDPVMSTVGFTLLAVTGCGLVGSALCTGSLVQRLCSTWLLRTLGKYSYFLYLTHFTLRIVVEEPIYNAMRRWAPTRQLATLLAPTVLVALLLCAAALSFRYFEEPLLRLKRHFTARSNRPKLLQDVRTAESG